MHLHVGKVGVVVACIISIVNLIVQLGFVVLPILYEEFVVVLEGCLSKSVPKLVVFAGFCDAAEMLIGLLWLAKFQKNKGLVDKEVFLLRVKMLHDELFTFVGDR